MVPQRPLRSVAFPLVLMPIETTDCPASDGIKRGLSKSNVPVDHICWLREARGGCARLVLGISNLTTMISKQPPTDVIEPGALIVRFLRPSEDKFSQVLLSSDRFAAKIGHESRLRHHTGSYRAFAVTRT
jgi:hypothetical protein